jgi:hypothetical protein
MWGEVLLAAETGEALPPGVAFDADGNSTQDGRAAARVVSPLAFAIQALGLLAGAAIPSDEVQDYGFLFSGCRTRERQLHRLADDHGP